MATKRIKKHITVPSRLQHLLTIAGLTLVATTIIATFYSLGQNARFINDSLDVLYYSRYALTVLAGFGIGLLFAVLSKRRATKKDPATTSPLFTAVVFGLLTLSLYYFMDMLRIPARELFGDPGYPWGKIIFEVMPLAALAIITLITTALFLKGARISASRPFLQWSLVIVFILQQLTISLSIFSYAGQIDTAVNPTLVLLNIVQLLFWPPVIALVAYVALGTHSSQSLRIFLAVLIAMIVEAFTYVLWEFRFNPEAIATAVFGVAVMAITMIIAIILIVVSRRHINK